MYDVKNFIKWALTHVNAATIPEGASLPLPIEECGTEPWHYLYGTVKRQTTRSTLEERWQNYYSSHGWKRADYDLATASFRENDYATDCQGLLDAYLTYECGEKTDINAHMNFTNWCTEKGEISDMDHSYVIGEALFYYNKTTRKMTHVGWVCGFLAGEPLVVEARGLRYGVVVTKLSERPWTHRGLMTKKFDYESEGNTTMDCTKFEVINPMLNGEGVRAMQRALNENGYPDSDGKALVEDGKWGAKSQAAFEKLLTKHSDKLPEDAPVFYVDSPDGVYKLRVTVVEAKEA